MMAQWVPAQWWRLGRVAVPELVSARKEVS